MPGTIKNNIVTGKAGLDISCSSDVGVDGDGDAGADNGGVVVMR